MLIICIIKALCCSAAEVLIACDTGRPFCAWGAAEAEAWGGRGGGDCFWIVCCDWTNND